MKISRAQTHRTFPKHSRFFQSKSYDDKDEAHLQACYRCSPPLSPFPSSPPRPLPSLMMNPSSKFATMTHSPSFTLLCLIQSVSTCKLTLLLPLPIRAALLPLHVGRLKSRHWLNARRRWCTTSGDGRATPLQQCKREGFLRVSLRSVAVTTAGMTPHTTSTPPGKHPRRAFHALESGRDLLLQPPL